MLTEKCLFFVFFAKNIKNCAIKMDFVKNKLIFTLKTAVVTAIMSAMLFSCAQMGNIDGGEKDTASPILKRSKPDIYSANFHKKKVKMKFDEFFTLEKIDQKFLMSPPQLEKDPKVKVRGKKVIVKLKEPLRQDTTYTFQFFDCLQDFHEGNHEPDFDFVFSTGPVVDSFAVAGHVFDAQTLDKEQDILVGLYSESVVGEDSCVMKYKPNYITRTDTAGYFKVKNIAAGRYKIFVLKDINESRKFDVEDEKIAFFNTLVEPEAQTLTKIDSLPAGTILHSGTPGHRIIDTLLNDTVIVQNILYTTPNNINLFAFNQIKTVQYISDRQRDLRQRFLLCFNKSVETDTVLITYVEDTLTSPPMVYDFNYNRDSLYVWLLDTADVRNDTLSLRVTFSTIDSLLNPITETDTVRLRYSVKKAKGNDKNAKSKTPAANKMVDSLCFSIKSNFSGDFDQNGIGSIQIPIPTTDIDSSRIRLYQLQDSTFEDDMNQKLLKAIRLDSAEFRLVFKRGIYGDIIFYPTDTTVAPDWYTATYSENRDTVNIIINDTCMIKKGRFKNLLKYYNEYYLGEIQKLRDTVNTAIVPQKILSYSRPSRDSIVLTFEKNPKRDIEVSTINVTTTEEKWADVVTDENKAVILIRDTSALYKDTLAVKLNTFDRYILSKKQAKVVERFYKDTLFAIYKVKIQKIKSVTRVTNDTMQFIFAYPLIDNPVLNFVDTVGVMPFYSLSFTENRDTMTVALNDFSANLDTLNYSITYPTLDRRENIVLQIDTLRTVRLPEEVENQNRNDRRRRSDVGIDAQRKKEEEKKNNIKATLRIPLEYQLYDDTLNLRNKLISYPWEAEKQYEIVVDDSAFTSILNTPNLYLTGKIKIRPDDYYGSMTINLLNTGNIEHYPDIDEDLPPFKDIDTARVRIRKRKPIVTDSTADFTTVSTGQLIVCLCDAKGDIKYSKTANCDGPVVFDYILPADYRLKIIHDRNMNKKWDTGDYLHKEYPERVISYPRAQAVKSKWQVDVLWRL